MTPNELRMLNLKLDVKTVKALMELYQQQNYGQVLQLGRRARILGLYSPPGVAAAIPVIIGNLACGTVGVRQEYGGHE